jgi:putative ABC transport system permease protein
VFNTTGSLRGDVKRDGEVVGVVPDEGQLLVYAPLAQHTIPFTRIIVSAPHAASLVRDVRLELRKLDPALVPDEVMSLEDMAGQRVELSRFYMALTQVFATVGLLLATIGVYAITSYLVHRRRHELAVRIALGATPRQVLAHVASNGLLIVVAGLAFGSLTAFVARGLIAALIISSSGRSGSSALGATSFAASAVVVTVAVGAALLVGAMRAMRLDPIHSLRELRDL